MDDSTSAPNGQEGPISHKRLQHLIPVSKSGKNNGLVRGLTHLTVVSDDLCTLLRYIRENRTALVLSPGYAHSDFGLQDFLNQAFCKDSIHLRLYVLVDFSTN